MLENRQFKLTIAYDGTDFSGWQIQKNGKSIANLIERSFKAVFKQEIHLIGASRTDAGVHAFGQVATFFTNLSIDAYIIQRALQASMPASVVIRSCELVPSSFHPRFNVVQKTYWYHFSLEQLVPWVQRSVYFHSQPLDLNLLEEGLKVFVGIHDFRSFCTGNDAKTTVRVIKSINLEYNDQLGCYRIVFKGPSFLRYMIRRIVGASLHCAQKKLDSALLSKVLEEKNPRQRLPTAPAHGLLLYEINYKDS